MGEEIVAVVQARMGSTRLPGKVLAPVVGRPMIIRQLERLGRARLVDRIVVATSCGPSDDELCAELSREGYPFYRGSEIDVLDRYYQSAFTMDAKQIIRITADCPLIDWDAVDKVVEAHVVTRSDYSSNRRVLTDGSMRHTYPHGMDTEIMTFVALKRAWSEALLPSEREHVTMYLYRHPERFKLTFIDAEQDHGHFRWTVDYPEDLLFVQQVYERLYFDNPRFSSHDVYALLRREPQLLQINAQVDSAAGLRVSKEQDQRFLSASKEHAS